MTKGKGTIGQTIQCSKAKGQADKQYNDQRQREMRTQCNAQWQRDNMTNNTMTKGKGTRGQQIQ
jgi:hypothetical protein